MVIYSFSFSQIKNAQNLIGKNHKFHLKKTQIPSNHGTGIMSSVVTTSKGKDMMEDVNSYRYTFNSATMVLRPSIGPGMPAWGSSAIFG